MVERLFVILGGILVMPMKGIARKPLVLVRLQVAAIQVMSVE